MKKTQLAQDIVEKLYATEKSVDAALVDATRLLTALIEARSELSLSATFGDETLNKLTEAVGSLNQARSATVATHNDLKEIHDALGIRGVAMAPVRKLVTGRFKPELVAS